MLAYNIMNRQQLEQAVETYNILLEDGSIIRASASNRITNRVNTPGSKLRPLLRKLETIYETWTYYSPTEASQSAYRTLVYRKPYRRLGFNNIIQYPNAKHIENYT